MQQATLNTVAQLIADVRVLLLDKRQPYRYGDDELIVALNTALLEGRRLRPDLFVTRWGNNVPFYGEVSGEEFCIEPQFRLAFVYGITAQALMRDDEDVQDQRANSFLAKFQDMLVGIRPTALSGGTPGGGKQQGS